MIGDIPTKPVPPKFHKITIFCIAISSEIAVIPVSYTHLDVYKRQALFLNSILLFPISIRHPISCKKLIPSIQGLISSGMIKEYTLVFNTVNFNVT